MNPIAAFILDLLEGAVLGAAVASLALPEGVGTRAAIALIALGAVKAVARVAIVNLTKFVQNRRAP